MATRVLERLPWLVADPFARSGRVARQAWWSGEARKTHVLLEAVGRNEVVVAVVKPWLRGVGEDISIIVFREDAHLSQLAGSSR